VKADRTDRAELPYTDFELDCLSADVLERTGFDPRDYSQEFLKAVVSRAIIDAQVDSLPALRDKLLQGKKGMRGFVSLFPVGPDAMFHDPSFFISMRNVVIPGFRYLPALKVWNPGCGSGAITFSLAVFLEEEGLYDRTTIYATDADDFTVQRARKGMLPMESAHISAKNYASAGGKALFSAYCTSRNNAMVLRKKMLEKVVWARHNPATDAGFNQFHLIVFRRPLSDYGGRLAGRMRTLLYESITVGGVLAVSHQTDMQAQPFAECYRPLEESGRIYRKFK